MVASLYLFMILHAIKFHYSVYCYILCSFVFSTKIFIILCPCNRTIQFEYPDEFLVIYLNNLNICEVIFSVFIYFCPVKRIKSYIKKGHCNWKEALK